MWGEGGRRVPPQDRVDICTHITKSYYHTDQYIRFNAAEKQKVWHNKGKQPRSAGKNKNDTYSIKELNVHIHQLSSVIKNHNKRISHIKTNNYDEELLDSSHNRSILNLSNRKKPDLGRHGHGSTKRTKGGK